MEKDRQLVSPTLPNASIASDSTFASSVPRSPRNRALGTTEPWSPKSPSHVELSVADFLVTPRDSFSPSTQRISGTRFTFTPKSRGPDAPGAPGTPGTPGQPHAHEGQPRPDSPASKDDDQLFELLSPLQFTSRNLLPRKKQPNEEPASPPSPLPTATLVSSPRMISLCVLLVCIYFFHVIDTIFCLFMDFFLCISRKPKEPVIRQPRGRPPHPRPLPCLCRLSRTAVTS